MPDKLRDLLIWLARLTVAGVFIYAAIPKLLDPASFAEDIGNYQAFPYWSWNFIAAVVPMLELIAGVALFASASRKGGVTVLAALNTGFIVLIASVIWRDIDLSCGCFGHEEEAAAIGWPTLLRDVVLMVGIILAGLTTAAERPALEHRDPSPPT